MIKWCKKIIEQLFHVSLETYDYSDYWPHTGQQPEHCGYCRGIHGGDLSLCPKPTIYAVLPYFSAHDWPKRFDYLGEPIPEQPVWHCTECAACFKKNKQWYIDRYNNTVDGAKLTCPIDFYNDGKIKYNGLDPIDADFEVTYESLAPYVTAIIDAAEPWDGDGIGFDAIVIRDGKVTIRP